MGVARSVMTATGAFWAVPIVSAAVILAAFGRTRTVLTAAFAGRAVAIVVTDHIATVSRAATANRAAALVFRAVVIVDAAVGLCPTDATLRA